MKRKTLILYNSGETGAENYCHGVKVDVKNMTRFIRSPIGGLWENSEIELLERPTVLELRQKLIDLKAYDYNLILFAGHGYYSDANKTTFLELKKGQEIDVNELKNGSLKQTIIVDCCRQIHKIKLEEMLVKAAKEEYVSINPIDCKKYYNKRIDECDSSFIITYSCSVDEKAYDDAEKGGLYTYSLIDAAEDWYRNTHIDTTKDYRILSIVQAHDTTTELVKFSSGNRQNPQITKPRSGNYYPFCIVA